MPARSSIAVPLIIGCAQFMHQFDGSVIATALPTMARSLQEDPLRLNLAITCYLLSLAVFVPVSGWLADRFGPKQTFMLAIAVFTLSSVGCGLSRTLPELVVTRTIQGLGGAMMTPVGRMIIVKSTPKSDLVRAMTYVNILGVLGPMLGPSVGGFIVTAFSWPWIFFINAPIGVLGLILVWTKTPAVRAESAGPLDAGGFILTGVGLASLLFGFETIGRGILPNIAIAGLMGLGAICVLLYVAHERREPNPIIDFSLLKIKTFWASIFGGSLFYTGTTAMVFLIALLLQLGFGLSAFQAGVITLASAAGSLTARLVFRPIMRALTFRALLLVNAVVMVGTIVACGFFRISTPYVIILIVLFVSGLSRSIQFTAVQSLTYADLPTRLAGRATSFSVMSQQAAQSFGVGLAAFVVHLSVVLRAHDAPAAGDVALGFFAIGAVSLASVFVFASLPREAADELRAAR